MKPVLRSLFSLLFIFIVFKATAQTGACNVSDLLIQNVRNIDNNPNDGICTVSFDVAFTISANQGNKYIFLQTYIVTATRNGVPVNNPFPYPNYFQCQSDNTSDEKKPPSRAQAENPMLNIAIDNSGNTPAFTNYAPDPTLPTSNVDGSSVTSITLSNGDTRFLISNVVTTFPNECQPINQYIFATDIFATNARSANTLNCVTCNIRTSAGFITVGGVTNCNVTSATFTNNTNQAITFNYSLFSDVNENGILSPVSMGGADVMISSGTRTLAANETISVTQTLTGDFIDKPVFVVLEVNQGGQVARRGQLLPIIECASLPVSFRSFTANRNGRNVNLRWETATEQNNRGFYVQRNSGGGWSNVTFVPSKAADGNSNTTLVYEHVDLNTEKVVTQYRLLQVDHDGKSKVSDIRSVRGEAQENRVMIVPNPTNTGSVNIMFDDAKGSRDVLISDMSGRLVKQFRSVAVGNLRVDNLLPGV